MQCVCAILPSVASPALQYFFILSHKRHDFRKKTLLNIKPVFLYSLQCLTETFLILRITEQGMIKMYIDRHVEYPLFLSDFYETNFLDRFSRNTQISNFMKIRSVGAELFLWTEKWTDGEI
jgi:hypothetical protein